MKKVLKFLVIMTVIAMVMAPMMVFADNDALSVIEDVKGGESADISIITNAGGTIYATIQTVGIVVALIVVVAFGIQWLTATPAKKAELKGKMWNIVIGVAIILLASTIVSQLGQFLTDVDNGGDGTSESEEAAGADEE